MIEQLKEILEKKPIKASIKEYLKRFPDVVEWVEYTIPEKYSDRKIAEKVHILLYGEPSCDAMKFFRVGHPYKFCGNKTNCQCKANHYTETKDASNAKRRETNKEKYGVAWNSQRDDIKEQKKQTCLEKFGAVTNLSTDETKAKIKQTNKEKYGVENPQQNDSVKAKTKATSIKRYGDNYTTFMRRDEFNEKMRESYGVEHALQNSDIKKKQQSTIMERFGVKYASQHDDVKEKYRQTMQEKYGCMHNQYHLIPLQIDFINDDERFIVEYNDIGFYGLKKKYNISSQIIRSRCKKLGLEYDKNLTQPETIIYNILTSLIDDNDIIVRDRTAIKPLELDFYIPKLGIAIEVCGLYWHSQNSGNKTYSYHQKKYNMCKSAGIRLLTIFENEIDFQYEIVSNRLKHILGGNKPTCYARQTIIKEISSSEYRNFLDTTHIQGSVKTSVKLGAYYKDKLVAVMGFGKTRHFMSNDCEYELLRFATGGNIPGMASKMFKYFLKTHKPKSIVSYCDLRWGTGGVYEQLGMKLETTTQPNYWYTKNYINLEYRYNYAKHKLVEQGFDKSKSEWEIMQGRGYDRIWDCGNKKFVWMG